MSDETHRTRQTRPITGWQRRIGSQLSKETYHNCHKRHIMSVKRFQKRPINLRSKETYQLSKETDQLSKETHHNYHKRHIVSVKRDMFCGLLSKASQTQCVGGLSQ